MRLGVWWFGSWALRWSWWVVAGAVWSGPHSETLQATGPRSARSRSRCRWSPVLASQVRLVPRAPHTAVARGSGCSFLAGRLPGPRSARPPPPAPARPLVCKALRHAFGTGFVPHPVPAAPTLRLLAHHFGYRLRCLRLKSAAPSSRSRRLRCCQGIPPIKTLAEKISRGMKATRRQTFSGSPLGQLLARRVGFGVGFASQKQAVLVFEMMVSKLLEPASQLAWSPLAWSGTLPFPAVNSNPCREGGRGGSRPGSTANVQRVRGRSCAARTRHDAIGIPGLPRPWPVGAASGKALAAPLRPHPRKQQADKAGMAADAARQLTPPVAFGSLSSLI